MFRRKELKTLRLNALSGEQMGNQFKVRHKTNYFDTCQSLFIAKNNLTFKQV